MKFDPLNYYTVFKPTTWVGLESIEIPIIKILISDINPKFNKLFDEVETYFMFIGYPRSGHTIIGSFLDAHPDAIVGNELDVLKYIKAGFTKNQIFYLILRNSSAFAKSGRNMGDYTYQIPNQWNGKYRSLKVIGDKKGGNSTERLSKNPKLLKELYRIIKIKKIKFIHVIRNPYDNITTISKKHYNNNLKKAINYYFSLCKTNQDLRNRIENVIEIKHESFINDPKNCLKKICKFLELDTPTDYINDCSSIVFKNPRKTRYNINWNSEYIEIVKNKIREFDCLKDYSFDK